MDIFAGGLGVVLGLFLVILAVLTILIPFAIFSMQARIATINKQLKQIIQLLEKKQ